MPLSEVMEVARYIGENAEQPEEMPYKAVSGYRWMKERNWSGKTIMVRHCPMGLLPTSLAATPTKLSNFQRLSVPFTSREIYKFAGAWDSLEVFELPLAMKQIWGD